MSVRLPSEARMNGVRLRWMQSRHEGERVDWAIDNVFVGGKERAPAELVEEFGESDMTSSSSWIEADNVDVGTFCGRRFEHVHVQLRVHDTLHV